jgi:hypothetical protein
MHKYAFAVLAMTVLTLPMSLRACDCDDPPVVIHFTDGIPSNGPVTGDPGASAAVEGGCPCSESYAFRDYGPARATPPPAPAPVVQQTKPTS